MTMVGTGKYKYEVIRDWAKWPPGIDLGSGTEGKQGSVGSAGGLSAVPEMMSGGTAGQVVAVATDSKDRVYVGRMQDPPVIVFDREGNYLSSWGNGSTAFLHALYVANETVYLVDRETSVCMLYTLDGKPIQMLGRHGVHSDTGAREGEKGLRAAGPFNQPAKMVPSPWGDLYIADGHHNARVHRFDNGGHLVQSWGQWGTGGPGEFNQPHSILVGRDNRIYVCDRDNDRIQIFAPNGAFLAMWTDVTFPVDIIETPQGDFAITERWGGPPPDARGARTLAREQSYSYRITILDRDGKVLTRLEGARNAHGLAIDSRGDMYLALQMLNNVDKYVYRGE